MTHIMYDRTDPEECSGETQHSSIDLVYTTGAAEINSKRDCER